MFWTNRKPEKITRTRARYQGLVGWIARKVFEEPNLKRQGYELVKEEEVKEYSAGKGCLLFLIFPPLAFFGKKKMIKTTWKLQK